MTLPAFNGDNLPRCYASIAANPLRRKHLTRGDKLIPIAFNENAPPV